ncbi:MAG: DUF4332 domain-containing protein [Anaerolineales bacterium]
MDELGFRAYLQGSGRLPQVIDRIVAHVAEVEEYFSDHGLSSRAEANFEAIEAFAAEDEAQAKTSLWSLQMYLRYICRTELALQVAALRAKRNDGPPQTPLLSQFVGISADVLERLAQEGIRDTQQMRAAAATPALRADLSERCGLSLAIIEELAQLADLSRLPGVVGVRAQLYRGAGYTTLDALASAEPREVFDRLRDYVLRSGFVGSAPWLSETTSAVHAARELVHEMVW